MRPEAAEPTLPGLPAASDQPVASKPRARRGRSRGPAGVAAALALTTALVGVPAVSAQAATPGRHFIQISTRGVPRWKAEAYLYNGAGKLVYPWANDDHWLIGGGKETWWYNAGSDGGYIIVLVHGRNGKEGGSVVQEIFGKDKLYLDHCFHIDPVGVVSYTGDSATGGCTSA